MTSKRFFKIAGTVAGLPLLALFLYANLRQPSLTEQMPPVHLKIFGLDRTPQAHEQQAVLMALKQQPGVTAVGFGQDGKTFSVTYRPDKITAEQLQAVASLNDAFGLSEKTFPPSPACPVPPLDEVKRKVLRALRIF